MRTLLSSLALGLLLLGAIGATAFAQTDIYDPEGINMPGAYNGWANPPSVAAIAGIQGSGTVLPDSNLATIRYSTLIYVNTTAADLVGGTYEWTFSSGPPAGYWNNTWKDVTVLMDSVQTYTYYTSGGTNNSVTLTDGKYYSVRYKDNPYSNTTAVWMATSAPPVTLNSVAQVPVAVGQKNTVSVSFNLSAAPSAEEKFFVRYSIDSWVTSAHAAATVVGTTATAVIPAQLPGVTVQYYVISSTKTDPSADYDMYTIKYDNNSKLNYSYSVLPPLAGVYPIPGAYPTILAAVTDLNSRGVAAPGATFNVVAGYSEPIPLTPGFLITDTTATVASPVLFQRVGVGPNPLITAGPGVSTTVDGIIVLAGSDYVTFDGLDLMENPANTTPTLQMEWGFGVLKANAGNGAQNVTVRNCVITLNKTNTASTGIYHANHTPASTTGLTIASLAGANSNNKYYSNAITNVTFGIQAIGYGDAVSPYAYYDQNTEIGVLGGNTITNFGGTATQPRAIYGYYQNNLKINNNGIYGGAGTTTTTRGIYTSTGLNSNVDIIGNTISITTGAASNELNPLQNDMGGSGTTNTVNIINNVVRNCSYPGATTGAFNGIKNAATAFTLVVRGNTVDSNVVGSGGLSTGGSYYAMTLGSPANLVAKSNVISRNMKLATGGSFDGILVGTVTTASVIDSNIVNDNYQGTSTSTMSLLNAGGAGTLSVRYNSIYNNQKNSASGALNGIAVGTVTGSSGIDSNRVYTNTLVGTGDMTLINGNGATTLSMLANQVYGNTKSGASGALYCTRASTAVVTYAYNQVYSNSIPSTSGSSAASIYGYYNLGSPTVENIYQNAIYNLTIAGTTSSTSTLINGIYSYTTSSAVKNIYQNNIHTFSSHIGSVVGVRNNTGTTVSIYKNNIYDLSSTAGNVDGLNLTTTTNTYVYNNYISDLKAPNSANTNGVVGINYISSTSLNTLGVYYNTIALSATSTGTNFGSSAIYVSSATPTVDLRNNILLNSSTPNGTGLTVAHRRGSTTLTSYAATSNNNDFYAGTPGPTRLIFYDGTNADQTIAAYKTRVSPRDASSFAENPPFVGAGTPPANLHMQLLTATQTESGGAPVLTPAITDDFDAELRNGTTPDVGADEFAGTGLDLVGPAISYTALGGTNLFTDRNLVATISDISGVQRSTLGQPLIYYKKGVAGVYQTATATEAPTGTFTFTLSATALGGLAVGDTVLYYVAAQDSLNNAGTNPGGSSPTYDPPNATVASPNFYKILPVIAGGTYTIGSTPSPALLPPGAFPTVKAFFDSINASVLTGNVVGELISNSSEAATAVLNAVNYDLSGPYTVTLRPAASTVDTISGNLAGAVIKLNGADNVIIDGSNSGGTDRSLTIMNTSTASSTAAIWVSSLGTGAGAANVTIKNAVVKGGAKTSGIYAIAAGGTIGGAGDDNDNLTIQNNEIVKAYYGIYANAAGTGVNDNLTIQGNTIGSSVLGDSIGFNGITVIGATGGTVTQNEIKNIVSSGSFDAVVVGANVTNTVFTRNLIRNIVNNSTNRATAISVAAGTGANLTFANNVIHGVINNGTGGNTYGSYAFYVTAGGGYKFYSNTVNMYGDRDAVATTKPSSISAAMFISGGAALDIRNNIFVNSQTAATNAPKSYAIYSGVANTAFTSINNNDYLASGAQGVLGYLGADQATLGAWQTATAQDAASISTDPLFLGPTDLRVALGSPVLAVGATGTGVTDDYTGALRASPPSIGAYENGTVTGPPNCATIVSPLDLAINVQLTATLNWANGGGGTTGYKLFFGTDNPPTDSLNGVDLLNVTTYDPPVMQYSTTYYWKVVPYNGVGDAVGCAIQSFTTQADPTVTSFPWVETFEDTSASRPGWSQIQVAGAGSWTYATGSSGGVVTTAYEGAKNARFVSQSPSGGSSPITKLVSPPMNLTVLTDPRLVYWFAQEEWAGDQNITKVYYRISPSDPWVLIQEDSASVAAWTQRTLDLPAASATYQVAFEGINNWGRANVVDYVTVEETPTVDIGIAEFAGSARPGLLNDRGEPSKRGKDDLGGKKDDPPPAITLSVRALALTGNPDFEVIVYNNGGTVPSYQVGWLIDGTPQTPVNSTEALEVGDDDTLLVTWSTPVVGPHTFQAYTVLAGDTNPLNDSSSVLSFEALGAAVTFNEGFNGYTFPPSGWIMVNNDASVLDTIPWYRSTTTGGTGSLPPSEGTAFAAAYYGSSNGLLLDDWLISPNTGDVAPPSTADSLTFWLTARLSPSGNYPDSLEILVSTTGTSIGSFTQSLGYVLAPKASWTRFAFALPQSATRHVAFRYYMTDGGPSGSNSDKVCLDDVRITRHAAGPAPVLTTFRVNMKVKALAGLFDPTADAVTVRGSFNDWGNSTNNPDTLTDGDNDSIYVRTIALAPNTSYQYKFWKTLRGGMEWEDGVSPNRQVDLGTADTTLPAPYFNNDGPDVAVTFQVNMSIKMLEGTFLPGSGDVVNVRGNFNGWGESAAFTDGDADSIYTAALQVPSGQTITYKFFKTLRGGLNWEADPNRTYVIPLETPTVIPPDYFDKDSVYTAPPVSPKFLTVIPDTIIAKDPAKAKFWKPVKKFKGLKPNWANLLDETVAQGGFQPGASESDSAGGMVVGISHMYLKDPFKNKWAVIKDSAAIRPWVRLTKWDFKKSIGKSFNALQKTLETKAGKHDLMPARGFDFTTDGKNKPLLKQMTKLDPKKQDNALYAEMLAMKFNIAASALGKTPAGFGELLFDRNTSMYDERSITQIAASIDTMMTYWALFDSADFADAYTTVYDINRAFVGPFDTASFNVGGLVLKGAIDLSTVSYLKAPTPFIATRLEPTTSEYESLEDYDFDDEEFEESATPVAAKLYQNYPNPFNPGTTIGFRLLETSQVTIRIYNMLGQEIAMLLSGEEMDEGYNEVQFNADALSSGVYFYQIDAQGLDDEALHSVVTNKMVLLK